MADYCTLDEVKSELDITSEENDDMLQGMIGQAKEFIDNFCDRQFDTIAATRYFDGAGPLLFIDDLTSISGGSDGIFLDEDGDGTFATTAMTATDYILYPLNDTPKTIARISPNSNYSGFASGIKKGVKIVATWGYGSTVPELIRRASIIQVCRWFKRKDSAFGDVIGTSELGTISMYKGLDPDIAQIFKPYKRWRM
ncbi:hypothetical protein ES703_09107 [subsurface metagenome]